MNRRLIVVTIALLAVLILLLAFYHSLFQLTPLTLISQKRYMRNDNKLLTEPTSSVMFAKKEYSGGNIVLGVSFRSSRNTFASPIFQYATISISSIPATGTIKEEITIPKYSMLPDEYVIMTIYESNSYLVAFSTEVLNATAFGGTTLTINHQWSISQEGGPYYFKFWYGTFSCYVDGFSFEVTPPTADFSYSPSEVAIGVNITFDGTLSKGAISTYEWKFESPPSGTTITTITKLGSIVTIAFNQTGNWTVTLTVTDIYSQSDSITKTIEVKEYYLTLDFTYTKPVYEKEIASFQASADGFYPPFEFYWDFGDNTKDIGKTVSHSYILLGNYTVTCTVYDSYNKTKTLTKTLEVMPTPKASFVYSPSNPKVFQSVILDASSSVGKTLQYFWTIENKSLTGRVVNYTVTYFKEQLSVSLTVNDGYRSDTVSEYISVIDAEHLSVSLTCNPTQYYNPSSTYDLTMTFTVFVKETSEIITPDSINCSFDVGDIEYKIQNAEGIYILEASVYSFFKDMQTRKITVILTATKELYYPAVTTVMIEMQAPPIYVRIVDFPKVNSKSFQFEIKDINNAPLPIPIKDIKVTVKDFVNGITFTTNDLLTIQSPSIGKYEVSGIDFTYGEYLTTICVVSEGVEYSFNYLLSVTEELWYIQLLTNPIVQAVFISVFVIFTLDYVYKRHKK